LSIRLEHDLLGEREVPRDVYWGIHTLRAKENFNVSGHRVHPELISALAQVKKSCARANMELGYLTEDIGQAIVTACDEIIDGRLHDQFIVDVFQGGAGTSTHMNANEVIANRAIEMLGGERGDYDIVHPNNHVNMHQSTNDVIPTAIRVAMSRLHCQLSGTMLELQKALKQKAEDFAHILKMGRTQHQDATPITLGAEFAAYAKVMGRDRHRIEDSEFILKRVNMGGTAIGTGVAAPIGFGTLVIEKLNEDTDLGLFEARDLVDATQNLDAFATVSSMLKVHAANISKITSDLMLMASGPRAGLGEITLPEMQAGSSLMPGKVNPVIGEMVEQVAMQVISNDYVVCEVIRRGRLELNAFQPLLSHCLFESISLLNEADRLFTEKCVKGIRANEEVCRELVDRGWWNWGLPALVPYIGYEKATDVARQAARDGMTAREVILSDGMLTEEELDAILRKGVTAFDKDDVIMRD
jgi:aspartate ammonia-lyase